jgi:hypothetical protein
MKRIARQNRKKGTGADLPAGQTTVFPGNRKAKLYGLGFSCNGQRMHSFYW